MAKVLIIGCGYLGTAIARRLFDAGHSLIGVRRSSQALPHSMQTIQADVTQEKTLCALENLNPNIVIYCVSAGGATDAQYQASYVQGLKNVLATQTNNTQLQHVFFVSSTRVYGQNTLDILDENMPAIAADFGGERLLEAENVLNTLSCKSTKLRLSGIYGAGRLYLVNMAKDVAKWPAENHYSNRIHRDDAASFIAFLADKVANHQAVADCYVVTDDMPTLQFEVLTWLANQQKIDTSQIIAPPAKGGKRLSNKRLRETGFALQYPNYQAGYSEILQNL
ncbi:MAG: NAD-dependent epimerase/dehydratase family protein [Bdellovibrio sp.]|nr:NAD-dependent epimerase/dehydratase family protein [Methylotenera sp.]